MKIVVAPVASKSDREEFVEFPYRLHARRQFWVPPLRRDVRRMLDPAVHPFHRHSQVECFLARDQSDSRRSVVGRVAAIHNRRHNKFHRDRVGFFGFFDAVNDRDVFRALLRSAAQWLESQGCDSIRGPCSFSTNEECGLLVEGFDRPASLLMPYSPPYYARRIEELGGRKARDLLSFWTDREDLARRVMALGERAARRLDDQGKFLVRSINLRRLDSELILIRDIYNSAWERNWGFVPMTDEEIDFMAHELRPIADERIALIAEYDGRAIGFALALPDASPILQQMNGSMGPMALLRATLGRREIKTIRVMALGVLPEFRRRGADAVLYGELARRGIEAGYWQAEFSWILEDNTAMVRAIEAIGGKLRRRHRIYEWEIREL